MRKHKKKFSRKQSVTRTVVSPAEYGNERTVVECDASAEGAIAVPQDDGTVKHFIIRRNVIKPAVVKTVANGPTTKRGKPNLGGKASK